MGKPLVDRTGIRFGSVVVVGRAPNYRGNARWCFQCDCGLYSIALGNDLQRGKVVSCGCENRGQRFIKHGMSRTPEYWAWQSMRQRCHNPSDAGYLNYGGRGIAVCDRWRDDFLAFYADMGQRPDNKHSLERVDNNRGYEPGNCQWVLIDVQANNKRRNRVLEYQGRSQTLAQWAHEYGMEWTLLRNRIDRYGWSVEQALTTPIGKRGFNRNTNYVTFKGHTQSTAAWARTVGITPYALSKRLAKGWPLERALTEPRRW